MSNYTLFEKEQSVVDHFNLVLQDETMEAETARRHLSALLDHYKKLLRQTQQLVKLNDSHANKLHQINDQLKQYSESLEYSASHDALTGLFNKGAITDIIRRQLRIGEFVLLLFDIDHFKNINDTFGHHVGDQVLNAVARLVENNITDMDYLGRFGGEEFIMVLNEASLYQCLDTADSLLKQIERAALVENAETRVSITVSMGLTWVKKDEVFEDVYNRVDKLLYAAKQNGRNRIESEVPQVPGLEQLIAAV